MEKPADACIKDNGETYEIQPEKEGTTLDTKKVQKVIRAAVSAGDKTVSLEKKNCYKKPSIYKDDEALKKDCDQMNKLISCVITYDFSDRSEQLDRNTIKDWLVRDANGDYIVNKDQVAAYVNSLGYKYDTFGCTRTFTTYDGRRKLSRAVITDGLSIRPQRLRLYNAHSCRNYRSETAGVCLQRTLQRYQ